MKKVAEESFRVLKNGKMCAVMTGDVRKHGNVIPLGFRMMECFLQAGFVNKEILLKNNIIVVQRIIGKDRITTFCFWHMSIYLFFKSLVIDNARRFLLLFSTFASIMDMKKVVYLDIEKRNQNE